LAKPTVPAQGLPFEQNGPLRSKRGRSPIGKKGNTTLAAERQVRDFLIGPVNKSSGKKNPRASKWIVNQKRPLVSKSVAKIAMQRDPGG
jgi:hypothetical protein